MYLSPVKPGLVAMLLQRLHDAFHVATTHLATATRQRRWILKVAIFMLGSQWENMNNIGEPWENRA